MLKVNKFAEELLTIEHFGLNYYIFPHPHRRYIENQPNKMGGTEGQTYCLRWNNHKSNLVEILDALIKMESYVDCTIYVDDHVQFKAHRVVLAANSPYFQSILQDVPMDHCSILFPGVQAFEMRALLEYMYTGEVNVTQSQIPRIMKIAEQLEVKGLFDITDLKDKFDETQPFSHSTNNNSANNKQSISHQSSPIISTSTNISCAQSSSISPTYSYKSPFSNLYSRSPGASAPSDRMAQWPPHLPSPLPQPHLQTAAAAMLSSVYDSADNPLKRKKLSSMSSMLMSRDTPILRNVLAQSNAADSSQTPPGPVPPMHHHNMSLNTNNNERNDSQSTNNSNGTDYSDMKMKYEEPHSPYTDKSFEDDTMDSTQHYSGDSRIPPYAAQQKPEWKRYKQYTRSDINSAIEHVRNGMSALQASRKFGVPSRTLYDKVKKMGITSGRPTNRTVRRSPSTGNRPAGFPYGISGTSSPFGHHMPGGDAGQIPGRGGDDSDRERDRDHHQDPRDTHHLPPTIPHSAAALLDATFLQQALEARGGDIAGREALHAMAFAAAAHAAVNGISTSPGTHGTARSPSPSTIMKYMRNSSPHDAAAMMAEAKERHSNNDMHERPLSEATATHEDEDNHVEDLSMGKRSSDSEMQSQPSTPPHPSLPLTPPQSSQQHGVIVPPMTTKMNSPVHDDFARDIKREINAENVSVE